MLFEKYTFYLIVKNLSQCKSWPKTHSYIVDQYRYIHLWDYKDKDAYGPLYHESLEFEDLNMTQLYHESLEPYS